MKVKFINITFIVNIFNINLNHLKYFVDAARGASLSRAANENFVTHSAISHAIKSLEAELDCSLIQHQRRAFELTPAGEYVLEQAKTVFDSVVHFREGLPRESIEIQGVVSFATSSSLALAVVAPVIAQLVVSHPRLQIKFKLGNSDTIKQWVKNKEVDFGIVLDDESLTGFSSQKLSSGTFCLVQAIQYKKDFKSDGVLLTRVEKPECRELLKRYKRKHRSDLKIKMQVLSWEVIKALVIEGAGFGYLPDYSIETELRQKQLRLVAPSFALPSYNLMAISLKTRKLSLKSDLVIATVKEKLSRK